MDNNTQSNNIYIGNRYVPVFADPVEWNNLRQYEPLTIVTYQGTSYTSKKTVPVGTPLNNTNYWVVTGNYNAQVQDYILQTQQLSTNLTQLNNSFNTFKSETELYENLINVKVEGVKGNGTTNDTAKIQSLINSNPNKTLYFPAGTYLITGLNISSNTIIVGENMKTTVFKMSGSNVHVFKNISSVANYCFFKDFTIDGSGNEKDGFNVVGNGNTFENIYVKEVGGNGFNISTTENNVLSEAILCNFIRCSAMSCKQNGFITSVPDTHFTNCYACQNGLTAKNTYDGFVLNAASFMINCHAWGVNTSNIGHRYACNIGAPNNLICNCQFEGATTANLNITQYASQIINCFLYFSYGSYDVIFQNGATLNSITNCHFAKSNTTTALIKFNGSNSLNTISCVGAGKIADMSGSVGYNTITAYATEGTNIDPVSSANQFDVLNISGNFKNIGTWRTPFEPTYTRGLPKCTARQQYSSNATINFNENGVIFLSDNITNATIDKYTDGTFTFVLNQTNHAVTITPPTGMWINDSQSPYSMASKERALLYINSDNIFIFKFA